MARILFVTWDGGGNVPPALGIAAELGRRGHAVRFLGHAQQRGAIEAVGFHFRPYENAKPWSSAEPVALLSGALKAFSMFTDHGPGQDLMDELGREPADLVVLDCMSLGALRAAERGGLRRAVLVHTYYRFLTHRWCRGPVGLVARLKGQNPTKLWANAPLVLVATDRELDPAADQDLPACVRYIGPVQPAPVARAAERESEPVVLVSLSTIYVGGQDRALQSILDAVAGLPVRAVVTTGEALDPAVLRPPPNARVHRRLPHADVMPRASLLVGHGGHATTMLALAHDLPMVIMPMHPMIDQQMIARSVEEQGAARVLPKTASAEQIRTAIADLLKPGPHRDAAARLGARLRAQDGASVAADQLNALLA